MNGNRILLAIILAAVVLLLLPSGPRAEEKKNIAPRSIGGIELVLVPGGSFMMGQTEAEKRWLISYLTGVHGKKYGPAIYEKWHSDETPRRRVEVGPFLIGRFEITQRQYRELMGSNPSYQQGDEHPVESVTWNQAMEFCRRFGEVNGVKARLPREAEWEYACRAGTDTFFHWGNLPDHGKKYGWTRVLDGHHPVGLKLPNRWGLYDMTGNVTEWCMDWYGEKYYETGPAKDPAGPETGEAKIARGDTWCGYHEYTRSAHREFWKPDRAGNTRGFRIVVGIDGSTAP